MIMMPYAWTLDIAAAHRSGRLLAPHRLAPLVKRKIDVPDTLRHRRRCVTFQDFELQAQPDNFLAGIACRAAAVGDQRAICPACARWEGRVPRGAVRARVPGTAG
jgi:hypothetical protein